jgi:hypothetical protein
MLLKRFADRSQKEQRWAASEGIVGNGKRGGAGPTCSRSESEFSAVLDVKERATIAG